MPDVHTLLRRDRRALSVLSSQQSMDEITTRETLGQRLVHDLRKSGFYSEMRAIRACTAAKWECRGSFTYFDKDERATRECDFEAVREWTHLRARDETVRVVVQLLGQVKKAEVPWIVFVDRHASRTRLKDASDNIIASSVDSAAVTNRLRRHSLIERKGWVGTGIHEAFKKPTDASRWYSAFVSACKAAESAYDEVRLRAGAGLYVHLIKPLVVLDGALIAAELAEDGELVLRETDSAAFGFEYRSDAYERPLYYLDLVTLEALPRYLASTEQRMTAMADVLRA